MNRAISILYTLIALLIVTGSSSAGEKTIKSSFWWAVDFNTIFDNREGNAKYCDNRTFFQTQLAPEIGLTLLEGKHRIATGVIWTQPIDGNWDKYDLKPTIYYRFESKRWYLSLGMFPRHQMIRRLPNYIWSDSNYYCQHNIRGALIQYRVNSGFFEAIVDWRSIPTQTKREAFNVIAQGEWQHPNQMLVAGGVAMMNHLAKTKHPDPDQNVVDDFMVNPYAGLELGNKVQSLDSLSVRVGLLANIARDRINGSTFQAAAGLWFDAAMRWHWLELKNTLYCGKRLFPFISRYGSMLNQGEPMYASKYFDRATIKAYILRKSFMDLSASLDFNFAEDCFQFYQRLQLHIYF